LGIDCDCTFSSSNSISLSSFSFSSSILSTSSGSSCFRGFASLKRMFYANILLPRAFLPLLKIFSCGGGAVLV
jgi:hypothetical protein